MEVLNTEPVVEQAVQESAPSSESTPPASLEQLESAIQAEDKPVASPGSDSPVSQAPEIPVYKPDLKYTAWGQEKELDPRVHGIIKSKEDEEWVKKLFSAADGVETFKQQRDQTKQEYAQLHSDVQSVIKAADMNDYKTAFEKMGVKRPSIAELATGMGYTKEEIIKHAYTLAQLTPEQESAQNRERELQRQNQLLQADLMSTRQQTYEQQVQTRTQELSQVMSQPDIAPYKQAFDAHHGQGAFWEEVKKQGILAHHMTGQDIPVRQAVDSVLRFMRLGQPAQAQQPIAQPQQVAPVATPAAQPTSELPVIPSVGSGGSSTPTKKRVSSVADIERELQEYSSRS